VADLDKALAETDAALKAAADGVVAKRAEAPKLAALLKGMPASIKAAEAAAVKAKEVLVSVQNKAKSMTDEVAILQRAIPALKAAQFNVGVLTEKEKLAKLEGDFNDYTAGKKENEEAKVAAAARIESSKKVIAEATAAMPQREATFNKLKAELAALEQAVAPTRLADAASAGKLEEQKKLLTTREAELAGLVKVRDDGIAAAKKSVDDINKAIAPLQKKLTEVAAKLAGPEKAVQAKKDALTKKEAALATLKKNAANFTAAQPAADKAAKDLEAAVPKATADIQAADQALAAARASVTQGNKSPEATAQVKQAQVALEARRAARAATEKALRDARNVAGKLKTDLANTTAAIAQTEKQIVAAKAEVAGAEKVAAPFRAQNDSISKEVAAQTKARADKQAAPAILEKDYAAKAQPLTAAIAQIKAAIVPLEKAFAEAHAKLDAEQKVVDAKKAETAKADADLVAVKKTKTDAEAVIVAAQKDIPQRDKNLAEISAELAKLQPQLDPLRNKVKQLEQQYFTMLPK
jgi:chromosome segregation ATPase